MKGCELEISNLVYTYSNIPILRDDQDYNYIEKTILSVLQKQKVSFKQVKEIFTAIELRLTEKMENTLVSSINLNELVEQDATIQGGNIKIPDDNIEDLLKLISSSLSKIATKGIDIFSLNRSTKY